MMRTRCLLGPFWFVALVYATTYPIDYSNVITTDSPTISSETIATETCDCDLVEGKCDYNCCCDTDCTATDKVRLFSCCCEPTCYGGQIASKPYKIDVHKCCCAYGETESDYYGSYTADQLYQRHLLDPSTIYVRPAKCAVAWTEEAAKLKLENMCDIQPPEPDPAWPISCDNAYRDMGSIARDFLCVYKSNAGDYANTDEVVYFPTVPTTTISSDGQKAEAGFGGQLPNIETAAQFPQYASVTTYAQGDPVSAAYITTSVAVESTPATAYLGMFLPGAGFSKLCDSRLPVRFGKDEDSSCLLEIADLSSYCAAGSTAATANAFSSIDALVMSTMIRVASSPGSQPGSSTGWVTGYLRAVSGITEWTQYASDDTDSVYPSVVQPRWDSNSSVCMNTLRNLTYHITYNASIAEIMSVNVSAEIGNISASSIGDAVVKQTFGVRWYSAEDSNISTYRPRSGSPGYIPGEPLLAGYPETSSIDNVTYSVFTQMAGGARIPTSGPGGACSVYSQTPILYDTPIVTQCTVAFASEAELQAYCESVTAGSLPSFLSYNFSAIGVMGNSNPIYTNNWTTVIQGSSLPTTSWLSSISQCASLVVGVEVDVVIGDLGETVAPQGAVFAAEVNYITDSFTFNPLDVVDGYQKFTHTYAVRFHKYSDGIEHRMPSITPVDVTVADDVMYPFYPFSNHALRSDPAILLSFITLALLFCRNE